MPKILISELSLPSFLPVSTSFKSILLICTLHTIFHLLEHVPKVDCVKGCVTFVAGDDYSMRQSICDKLNTHFQTIPLSLPSEVIKLTVNHQDIIQLNASQFNHLPNLTFLNLDSNKIKIIHPNTFNNLNKLQTLSLRYNFLTISHESFHPNVINGLIGLQHINLLHNPIGNVPNHFFLPISKTLRSIVLSGGSTDFQLNKETFYGLWKLQLLDLSNNHLESLPEIYEGIFSQMQLQELYLYGNPWKCDCHLRWLKVWFLKYGKKLIYSKPINDAVLLRNNIDIETNNWLLNGNTNSNNNGKLDYHLNDVNTLLQPKCASPIELHGRPLFSQINNAGVQAVHSTDFYCPPEVYTPNQQIQLILGNNSTLLCNFFADPSGIVVWYKDGIRIQNHWPRTMIKQSQGKKFQAELTIENIQPSDAGTYVCYLDTGYGYVNTTFNVQVDSSRGGGTSLVQDTYQHHHDGVFYWISKLDTTLILKYTGMIATCLIVLLLLMGLTIYFFSGKHLCRPKLDVNKQSLSIYDDKSDHHHQLQMKHDGLDETDTFNSSSITEKNTISNSRSSYTLHGQNLKLCTSLASLSGNKILLDKLSPTSLSALDRDHIYLHTDGTGNQLIDEHNLLSSSQKSHHTEFDNYVTVRLLPTVTRGDLSTMPCPIHNYAFLHPVSSNPVTVTDAPNASANTNLDVTVDGVSSGTSRTVQLTPDTNLLSLSNNTELNSLQNSNLKMLNTTEEQQLPTNNLSTSKPCYETDTANTHELNSSLYTPCPLHGNLYATLQTKDKRLTTSEIRKHIASVPPGLTGLNYEKHYTLPSRKLKTFSPSNTASYSIFTTTTTTTVTNSPTTPPLITSDNNNCDKSRTNTTGIMNNSSNTCNSASISVKHK
ncbi:unnamed protein product [Trichobilharzia szidati]|nr:unnamed protein product [Trichobilharzia szidati]